MALTPLEILKINLNENQYPVFNDEELENLLIVNDNNVLKASWRGCLMKANTDKRIKVGPIEVENADPDYWNNLAAMYQSDYLQEQSNLNPSKCAGYKTSMRRADGC
ncbi:hypothetical protein P9J83_15740 [Clostridium sporogenes]|uniref:Uncharacterized protein n=1 Tax=Clostridium sporogenes TaxID=1509 RepID=A0AAE4FPK4_CLOSG|nr:hypothetical protein [Clostridium sporogenes]MDS1004936.1 hypothetical protein [Clostridium sporogenes]